MKSTVILGLGLAGAAFACAHQQRAVRSKLVLVDPHSTLQQPRNLCFFETSQHIFSDLVSKRWAAVEVINARGARQHIALPHPYARLWAPDIHAHLQQCLPDIQILPALPATVDADLLLDSRPRPSLPPLLQHFVGFEVQSTDAVFDPNCATLMDFSVDAISGAVHFCYVLPWDRHRALVEDTFISAPLMPPPDYRANTQAYLSRRWPGHHFELQLAEQGRLPMDAGITLGGGQGQFVDIGTRGGFLRAATGYSTADTLRAAAMYAREPGPANPTQLRAALRRLRPRLSGWMDRVFLRALAKTPEQAPALFCALFANTPPATWIAFMNGTATTEQHLGVMRALPPLPLLRAL